MKYEAIIRKLSALCFILFAAGSLCLTGQTARLIIIDTLVESEHKNIRVAETGQKAIILPAEGNPVKLINDELKKAVYGEIHLFMLTKPGSIIFDEINIIPDNIEEYAPDFREWKSKLKQGSKIFIHSSDLTSIPEGLIIVQKIREYTGCEVIVKE